MHDASEDIGGDLRWNPFRWHLLPGGASNFSCAWTGVYETYNLADGMQV